MKRIFCGVLSIAIVLSTILVFNYVSPLTAEAAGDVIEVKNTNDSGNGSLRQVLGDIEDGGTITFANGVEGTIFLEETIFIEKNISIIGENKITLDGQSKWQILNITASNLTVSGVTFQNGYRATSGGAIFTRTGDIILDNCSFKNNFAKEEGGAIFAEYATIIANNCSFKNNSTERGGGAIFTENANITLNNCLFENNSTKYGAGGAISVNGGNTTLDNCTFEYNSAEYYGGAISTNDADIMSCAFEQNLAEYGGAILANGNTIFTNCSIIENISALSGSVTIAPGSSIYLYQTTIANNTGIGITVISSQYDLDPQNISIPPLYLYNSIISGNTDYQFALGYRESDDKFISLPLNENDIRGDSLIEGINGVTNEKIFGNNKADDGIIKPISNGIAANTATPLNSTISVPDYITKHEVLEKVSKDILGENRSSEKENEVSYGAVEAKTSNILTTLENFITGVGNEKSTETEVGAETSGNTILITVVIILSIFVVLLVTVLIVILKAKAKKTPVL